jgi:cathepsin A (carboxypeptidase C)
LDTQKDKHYFFWFFESRSKPSTDPILLWLNGGPGCTSFNGLLTENGPCRLDNSGNSTITNPYSWNNNANIIYLDQPLGVGYSYGKHGPNNTVTAAEQVYVFLQLFFHKFPKYKNLDFHVTGESYGGHYIPAIGKVINDKNKKSRHNKINLKSIAIGNGDPNASILYESYPTMACNSSYPPVLPQSTCDSMIKNLPKCKSMIEECNKGNNVEICVNATNYCDSITSDIYSNAGLDIYDVRTKANATGIYDADPSNNFAPFLNRTDIKQILGADINIDFNLTSCSDDVYNEFVANGDEVKNFHQDVAKLLDDGIRALIYNGDADFICNWYNGQAWTLALDWKGKSCFNNAKMQPYKRLASGKEYGQYRTYGNLTFIRVYEAGHMVPYYQPEGALDMINRWISQTKF